MVNYKKFELENGLKLIVNEDHSTPLACVNILYDVGARDEHFNRTGFAHLFEHLMFGGSANIPNFDSPLEQVGGDNNAFTTNDITNYYLSIPSNNIETAFWLESDRMNALAFSQKSLDIQRQVVVEEFKQRYLNQPYGDVWLLLRPLTYKKHPYQWSTIGKEIAHIEEAKMEEVKNFFYTFYRPNNARLVVSGNVKADEIFELTKKWFGDIPKGEVLKRNLPQESSQKEARVLKVERDVPLDAFYKVYHMCGRNDPEYYASDLLSDVLSRGDSSRLYIELVKNKKLFSELHAYVSGDIDPGLFVISGKLIKGITMDAAEKGVQEELDKIMQQKVSEQELTKVKNKVESTFLFSEMEISNKALNLAIYDLMGDVDLINTEMERYLAVTTEEVQKMAQKIFRPENSSTLYYHAKKK